MLAEGFLAGRVPGSAGPLCGEAYCIDGRKVGLTLSVSKQSIVQRLGNYPDSQCHETTRPGPVFGLGLDIAPQSVIEEGAAPSIETNLTPSEK